MGFRPLGEAAAPAESGGFRPLEPGRSYAAPLPEDNHAPLDLTPEEEAALPAQLARQYGQPSLADTARAIVENMTVGRAEAGMNLGTGFVAQIPAGLAGLATLNPENVNKVAEALTYEPRTAAGKRMTAAAQYPFEKYEQGADWAGETAREFGATPAQAAALKTTLMFPPLPKVVPRGTAVSTVVRPAEVPAVSPIEEWLARKAQERAGPIQDVSEAGGVPPGQNLTPTEPARPVARPAEPKPVEYQPYPDLSPTERAIEARAGEYVTQHTDEAIAEYKNRFGNVISTDNARELSADYLKDRTQSVAVHEPFSALMKEIYRRDLQEPAPEGKENAVVFTAGGTGAGKTHAVYANGETASLANRAQIVYDTNMNRYESAKTKVDQALDAGKRAVVLYVYRDPVTALVGQPGIHGVIQRAIGQKEKYGSGRTVPLSEHANTHIGSRDVIERLAREYEGNPMVSIFALHNQEPGVKPPLVSLTGLPRYGYNELYGRLQTALNQEHAAGRVPEEIYNGIAREAPRAGVREGDAGSRAAEPVRSTQEPEAALVGVEGRAASLVKRDSKGRVIGGFGARHLNAVNATLRRMETLAREGEHGKSWYEDSARELLRVTEGDKNAADRIAQVLAITSAGTEIKANFTMASKALEQYARGEPIKVATGQKNLALENLLRKGIVPESVKVDDFYRNLAQHISGEMTDRPVTDRWQFRIASGQKGQDKGSPQQYEYTSMLAAETAKRLGWRPDEAQAAMWVAMKARARYEMMRTSARESENSKFKGLSKDELKRLALENAKTSFASEIRARDWKPPEGIKFPPLEELRQVGLDENRMASDMFDQLEFLDSKARDLGYPDAQALFDAKPREFNRLAEEWRNQHELTQAGTAGHGVDQIAVSLEEPTGKITKTLEAKFETEVYLERYQRHLIPSEKTLIGSAVRDVISAGMPEHFLEAANGFTASLRGTDASFNVLNHTVSVKDILDVEPAALRGYLAHEMTHAVDHEPGGRNPKNLKTFISATSPRLGLDAEGAAWGLKGTGDISAEIVSRWTAADNFQVTSFFDYPLGRDFPEGLMKLELFAQMSRLYITNQKLMQKELPIAYSAMKEIYDAAGTSLEETRNAIRTTLQTPGAIARPEGPVVRDGGQGELFQAAQRGAGEWSPGERVVGVEAGPEHGGRPPDEGKRSVVGVQGSNPHWDIDQPGLIDNLTRQWQNNQIDLKKVQEAIERFGGVIKEPGNAYLAEELYRDRVTARIKQAYKNGIEPILKDIKNANLTVDETGKYLWARHAPERNVQMEKINPGEDDLSGLSNAEAAKILASFPAAKRAALDRIGEKIDALTASTRQALVKNGLEEPSTIAAWEGAYKHYVPLFRDVDEVGTGSGFQVRGPESKRATGSHREAQAVLAATIAQHERAIVRAEKANVGRALIKLAEEFPNPDFWKVDQPPMKRTVNPTTGLVQTGVDPMYRQRDDVLIVKQADSSGKVVERVLAFNPKNERAVALAHAMKNLDTVQLGAVTKVVGKITRVLANLATSWNPAFWTTNAVRDVQTAAVNLQSTPLRGRAPAVIANIPRALAGVLSAEFADGKGKWATAYRQFEMEGGKMEWASMFNDLVDRSEALAAEIKASQRGNINPAKWGSMGIDVVEKTNSAIENMTRLSAFVEGVDRGMSPKAAASLAKNLTVNFRRKGNQSTATGAWFMFFNANVQGTARMIQGLAKSRRAQAIVGTMVAFGAALELVNRMIGEQNRDEEGNNPYELIPEDVRSKNMIIMLKGGKKASLPLAYGFSVFHNAGRMMMENILAASGSKLVDEKKKPLETAWNFAKVLIDSFMPLGNTTTPAQFISPSILDPVVQYAENKTWYGGPIRPEPQSFGPATPNHKLYFRETSDMAKDLTKWLSDLTGGDEVQGGSIDISPTTVTHILGTATGGAGQFGLGMFDFTSHMVKRITGEETSADLPMRKVPFVGKFYGEVDDRDKAAKFYRLRSEAMDVWKKMETYRKAGDYDKASKVEEGNPALAAMARELVSKPFKKEMSGFRQEFKTVVDLPRDERQRERDRLRAEETSTMSRAIEAFNAAARESR